MKTKFAYLLENVIDSEMALTGLYEDFLNQNSSFLKTEP